MAMRRGFGGTAGTEKCDNAAEEGRSEPGRKTGARASGGGNMGPKGSEQPRGGVQSSVPVGGKMLKKGGTPKGYTGHW